MQVNKAPNSTWDSLSLMKGKVEKKTNQKRSWRHRFHPLKKMSCRSHARQSRRLAEQMKSCRWIDHACKKKKKCRGVPSGLSFPVCFQQLCNMETIDPESDKKKTGGRPFPAPRHNRAGNESWNSGSRARRCTRLYSQPPSNLPFIYNVHGAAHLQHPFILIIANPIEKERRRKKRERKRYTKKPRRRSWRHFIRGNIWKEKRGTPTNDTPGASCVTPDSTTAHKAGRHRRRRRRRPLQQHHQ